MFTWPDRNVCDPFVHYFCASSFCKSKLSFFAIPFEDIQVYILFSFMCRMCHPAHEVTCESLLRSPGESKVLFYKPLEFVC